MWIVAGLSKIEVLGIFYEARKQKGQPKLPFFIFSIEAAIIYALPISSIK
jgi:hypothetical protein